MARDWGDVKDFPQLENMNTGKEFGKAPVTHEIFNKIVYALIYLSEHIGERRGGNTHG